MDDTNDKPFLIPFMTHDTIDITQQTIDVCNTNGWLQYDNELITTIVIAPQTNH
jgi:hypothetical protein